MCVSVGEPHRMWNEVRRRRHVCVCHLCACVCVRHLCVCGWLVVFTHLLEESLSLVRRQVAGDKGERGATDAERDGQSA